MFSIYTIKARLLPSLFCLFPFIITYYFLLKNKLNDFINFGVNIELLKGVSVFISVIFIYQILNRSLGKYIFEDILFSNKLDFPTTKYLLWDNDYFTKDYKEKVYKKVENDFGFILLNEKEYKKDKLNAKKKISEAVKMIIGKTRDSKILLDRNIEYGLWRNLIGGSLISFLISLINLFIFYQNNNIAFYLSLGFFIIYGILLILSKLILRKHGENYAETLFQEYLK